MALANCPKCGSLFNKITKEICPKCVQEEEDLLRETQDFLRENRNAMMFQVVEELDIEQSLIEKWVKEKRIVLNNPDDEASKKRCIDCGREITGEGNICKTCQLKRMMKKGPAGKEEKAEPEPEERTRSRGMHFKRD